MKFNSDQRRAINLAIDNSVRSLFVTGSGGTGKSAVINEIIKHIDQKDLVVLAPTVSAAMNVGGETLHSFFKIKPIINENAEREDDVLDFNLNVALVDVADGKTVIIDEVSMLGKKDFKSIISRLNAKKLILVGDPIQLKPVNDVPVNWSKVCDETVLLQVNYRTLNEKLEQIINKYRGSKTISSAIVKKLRDVDFDNTSVVLSHKNRRLSYLQKHFLGYTHAKVGDVVLTFGSCDDSIVRTVKVKNKMKIMPYFINNDLLRITKVCSEIYKGLWECEVERLDNVEYNSKYRKIPTVMVGDYDIYKKHLQRHFGHVKQFRKQLQNKYCVDNIKSLKTRMNSDEKYKWKELWLAYFKIKNSPFARHHQFRTTYKAQGKAFEHVICDWNDLPDEFHKYTAISRTISKLDIVK